MLTKPRRILHLEGAAIFIAAIAVYLVGHYPWWLFAVLFLAPDVFILGYLIDVKWGATVYNLVHTLTLPLLLLAAAFVFTTPRWVPYGLIWLAHIGIDRGLGFGLKYPTFFKDTHLQHV
jgi:hypothetical protein